MSSVALFVLSFPFFLDAFTPVSTFFSLFPRDVLEDAGKSNGQVTPLMSAFLQSQSLPDEIRKGEPLQNAMRGFMNVAEKDLAWALQLARKIGVSMPVTGLVSQSMARIYGVEDPGRR